MSARRVVTVVGARPQFVKAATVSRAIAAHNAASPAHSVTETVVHTGQHYDANLSGVFFEELGLRSPAHHLGVGSGTQARQTAQMLAQVEAVLEHERPDWLIVYGDTNSTLAGALAAAKLHIPIAHVEAGLRSFNRRMPEEINRVLTDRLSALLCCPTRTATANLAAEGITDRVRLTGDVMYDSLLHEVGRAERRGDVLSRLNIRPRQYVLATVHRAENTDDAERLDEIVSALEAVACPVVWPMHPRARARLAELRRSPGGSLRILEPVSYHEMLMLEKRARVIATDSGGVQKEAYFFGVPCVTLRDETEWVELVQAGWNRLAGARRDSIASALAWAASFEPPPASAGLYGDGHAAEAVVRELLAA